MFRGMPLWERAWNPDILCFRSGKEAASGSLSCMRVLHPRPSRSCFKYKNSLLLHTWVRVVTHHAVSQPQKNKTIYYKYTYILQIYYIRYFFICVLFEWRMLAAAPTRPQPLVSGRRLAPRLSRGCGRPCTRCLASELLTASAAILGDTSTQLASAFLLGAASIMLANAVLEAPDVVSLRFHP